MATGILYKVALLFDLFLTWLKGFHSMAGKLPQTTTPRTIPFQLHDREGIALVRYGTNTDPVASGFDILQGLNFNSELCRGYPFMHASIDSYGGSGYRTTCGWLQVITSTRYESPDANEPSDKHVSADVLPSMDDLNIPFAAMGNLPQFFDAPCRNLWRDGRLEWVADTFLTTVPGRSKEEPISRLLGFRWGYTEWVPEERPVSLLPLEVTGPDAWNIHLPFLRKEYPMWRFSDAD